MVNFNSFNNDLADLQASDTSLFEKQVIGRLGNLLAISAVAVHSIKDGIEGSIGAVLSIVPYLGKSVKVNKFSHNKLNSFGLILSKAYVNALGVINPNSFLYTKMGSYPGRASFYPQITISHESKPMFGADEHKLLTNPLFFTENISHKIFRGSQNKTKSKNSFEKHIVSRLGFAAAALLSPITRTADLALGLVSAAFSVLTLGHSKALNYYAARGLSFPLVVSDVVICAQRVLYPYNNSPNIW